MDKFNIYMKELGIDKNSIHSAIQISEITKAGEDFEREKERKEKERIQFQNEPIIKQLNFLLDEEKKQNEKLQSQIDELKIANENSMKEAEMSKIEAKKSKRFTWITFIVSSLIALASLVVAIIAIFN